MKSISYEQCASDPCVFVRTEGTKITIIAVYFDDVIIIPKNSDTMKRSNNILAEQVINIEYDEKKRCLWMH